MLGAWQGECASVFIYDGSVSFRPGRALHYRERAASKRKPLAKGTRCQKALSVTLARRKMLASARRLQKALGVKRHSVTKGTKCHLR